MAAATNFILAGPFQSDDETISVYRTDGISATDIEDADYPCTNAQDSRLSAKMISESTTIDAGHWIRVAIDLADTVKIPKFIYIGGSNLDNLLATCDVYVRVRDPIGGGYSIECKIDTIVDQHIWVDLRNPANWDALFGARYIYIDIERIPGGLALLTHIEIGRLFAICTADMVQTTYNYVDNAEIGTKFDGEYTATSDGIYGANVAKPSIVNINLQDFPEDDATLVGYKIKVNGKTAPMALLLDSTRLPRVYGETTVNEVKADYRAYYCALDDDESVFKNKYVFFSTDIAIKQMEEVAE